MSKLRFAVLAAAALSLFSAPGRADDQAKCRLMRVAALDMGTSAEGKATIPASIDGHPLTLAVDTAGILTTFAERTVTALGIPYDIEPASHLYIYGGIPIKHYAQISNLRLGNLPVGTLTFPLMPDNLMPTGVDGTVSPDLLANFDLDFDFADAKLNLFSRDHCTGKVIYWTHDPAAVSRIPIQLDEDPMAPSEDYHIIIHVTLDGQEMKAIVDTGASDTVLSYDKAQDAFSLNKDSAGMRRVPAPNGLSDAYTYPFKQLSFAGVTVGNPKIVMVPNSEAQMNPNAPDLVVGMNVLQHLHVYIAYGEKTLYVSSAGAH
jgi:hypothetical protein